MTPTTAPAIGLTPPAPPAVPRKTLADLLHDLGDVPAHRVRLYPYPGTATEADVLRVNHVERYCELIGGTLVDKPMSTPEAFLTSLLIQFLGAFVRVNKLGITTTPDAQYRMLQGNLRLPDVAFTRKDRLPNPFPQVSGWCPDLCVEVLSPDNSKAEMALKRGEYFQSGCRLVWEIDPRGRTVDVYTDATTSTRLTTADTLDGGSVLPGFALPLADLFAAYDEGFQTTP